VAVNTYEVMFLIDSNKYAGDPDGSLGEINKILERVGAETLAARPWQDGKLAYPVEGRRKGLHYLTYLKMEGKNLDELTRLCKLNDIVLRHLTIKLDAALVEPMVAVANGESPTATAEKAAEEEKAASEKPAAEEKSTDEASEEVTTA
tara:strand:+ start:287 stop:730 length:444 start_codon:yes stop_codon:yes gene_type:complete